MSDRRPWQETNTISRKIGVIQQGKERSDVHSAGSHNESVLSGVTFYALASL